uniref:Glycosyltransferase n=1 Tax=Centella asiatica TaxID=48106 RepID=A0A2I7M6D4_CENAS|nr:UDP-glucosyltransferase 73AH2 [Centella asiatica]
MDSKSNQLHLVLIPLMSPGHLIPMVDMAKLLTQRAVNVTIITTPRNATRSAAVIGRAIESGLPIRVLQVRFPSMAAGLPEGCENMEDVPSHDMFINFFKAIGMLQEPMEKLFEEIKPSPSCIISDKNVLWTAETAKRFQIPWIIFDGMSCFTQLCTHNIYTTSVHTSVPESEPFDVPGLPDRIQFTNAQLPGLFRSSPVTEYRTRIREAEGGAHGVVINSFEELEKDYLNEFKKVRGDKVWSIGPLSLCNIDNLDKAQRGSEASIDKHKCLEWLDSCEPGSVVYACLGSLSSLSPAQLMELALGLEAQAHPFIWVVKTIESKQKEIEKWISEEGFEERIKGRGLVIRGWALQVLILSHPAIGGFLTHCGWNSTMEGVCAGVPMVTWPLSAEQFFNEKLIVQVLGTGVSVGARVAMNFREEENYGVKVRREDIKEAIECLMFEGEEGEKRRKRARKLAEMAVQAVEEGGSSHLNLTLLIQDIIQYKTSKLSMNTA